MNQLEIQKLRNLYQNNELTPAQLCNDIREKSAEFKEHNIWIHLLSAEEIAPYLKGLNDKDFDTHPLWGIPFAIKDNIDLENIPTTAGCPDYAYVPTASATVVAKLIAAGAIPIGKTNLDQFATGLNGTRSPYGACHNAYQFEYISGGSSSGSAVAVALGLAAFSLGTDTAGSGRVPACFNHLVGLKPTRGLLSNSGLVPACKSLDCISIFALNTANANTVLSVAEGFDEQDGFSRTNPYPNKARHYGEQQGRLKIGVIQPAELAFFGDDKYQAAYEQSIAELSNAENIELVEISYQAFDEAAKLLYEGPWVSERYLACGEFIESQANSAAINPVVAEIVLGGKDLLATDLFKSEYRLQELKQQTDAVMKDFDCLLFPTAGRFFTIAELEKEPIKYNSQLGHYTNFLNLLDLSAVAIPTVKTTQDLPFGITLVGFAFQDRYLLSIGRRLESIFNPPDTQSLPKPVINKQYLQVAVCGAHLEGLPLNWQLTERGAYLLEKTHTAPIYRMYLLENENLLRPGLILDEEQGNQIEIEIWNVPFEQFGSFVDDIMLPLGIGKVQTIDGRWVNGFICEGYVANDNPELTKFGGWRSYMAHRNKN